MRALLDQFLDAGSRLTPAALLDIFLVALLIYQAIMLIRGRRAAHIISGLGVIVLVYVASLLLGLTVLRSVLETLAPYTAFALIVMFQSELRRMLSRIGERRWVSFGSRLETREVADEILLAVNHLAAHRIGALIVVERDIGLRTFIESGVPVDARVTRDLLLAVFQPGGALHDGAVIVQGGRLAAAACFLPLTMNPELSRKLGTRHRAAIGVTEESDCLAIVVSEERGSISIAALGDLEIDVPIERLAHRLGRGLSAPNVQAHPAAREAGRP
ncbi:MAG: TIGR00159 family protein [Candidatus Solibacter usitatus]|nr:TIGR00159 family protein [Candidatus Solibacter usitatus]